MSDDAEDRDLLRRVLEDRHHRDDRRTGRRSERQRVLEADPALGLAGRDQRLGRRGARTEGSRRSTPASPYQPFAAATKKPVWFVFGVQSSARRTVPSAVGGRRCRRGRPWPERQWTAGDEDGPADGVVAAGPHEAARSATNAAARNRLMRSSGHGSASWTPCRARNETPSPKNGDGVNESTGLLPSPVLAGSGSAGLWRRPHSQRARRSPEAVFGCALERSTWRARGPRR